MKNPFKQLLKNVIGNSKLRPRRRTVTVDESGKSGIAKIPYGETLVDITVDDLRKQYEKQDGRCYWLGYKMNTMDIFESNNNAAMSVDRLDNNSYYKKDNIVICTRFANLGRRTMSIEKMKQFVDWLKSDIKNEIRKNTLERFF